ncbi:MAG: SBBP repeat-containing protein [Spirulina sp.]
MQTQSDWLTQLGTAADDNGQAIVLDKDENYVYATGYTWGTFSDSAEEIRNVWVAKFYIKSGEQIWLQQFSLENDKDKDHTSYGIAIDDDGVYLAIETQTASSKGSRIVKVDCDTGDIEEDTAWPYQFSSQDSSDESTEAENSISGIVADGNGYLYATGYVNGGSMLGSDGEALSAVGSKDVWLAKLSTAGELVWIDQFGSESAESVGISVTVDESGNVYAVGNVYTSGSYYTTGIMSNAIDAETGEDKTDDSSGDGSYGNEVWIAKYVVSSDDSNELSRDWIAQFGGGIENPLDALIVNHEVAAVAVDDSGGVYAVGRIQTDHGPTIEIKAWVAKFRASSGEQVWIQELGVDTTETEGTSIPETEGTSIAVDNYGGVYIAGWTKDVLADSITNTNTDSESTTTTITDAWIAKYNANTGEQVWIAQFTSGIPDGFEGDPEDEIFGIAVDSSGNLYVTGDTQGEISNLTANEGNTDIWLARFREVPEDNDELTQVLKRYISSVLSTSNATDSESSTSEDSSDDSVSTSEESTSENGKSTFDIVLGFIEEEYSDSSDDEGTSDDTEETSDDTEETSDDTGETSDDTGETSDDTEEEETSEEETTFDSTLSLIS